MVNLLFSRINKKYHTAGTSPKNRKTAQKGKLITLNTHMHNCSLSWLSIGTSITRGVFKLV